MDDVLGTTLAVFAHPDDETYLAGGVLASLAEAGGRAVCVTATYGEAWDPAADTATRQQLARTRQDELAAALRELGVVEHHWLGHPDGGCADVEPQVPAAQLRSLLDEVRPATVLTFGPDGFTGHPDHRAVSRWVDLAVERSSEVRVLHAALTPEDRAAGAEVDDRFGVYELGEPRLVAAEELAVRLELDGPLLRRKVAALRCQWSQTGPIVETLRDERFAAGVAVESFVERGRP